MVISAAGFAVGEVLGDLGGGDGFIAQSAVNGGSGVQ
jgi:hypothetical protein